MDIDSIPKKYGGNLDFVCGKMPILDPAVKNVLDLSSPESEHLFLTAPVKWVDDVDGDMTAVGVGSVDGKERRETVATLHSFAKLALSRSNRPRYERTPTNSRPQSSVAATSNLASSNKLAPLSTMQGVPVLQQNPAYQTAALPLSMTAIQGDPTPQVHQVSETKVPIQDLPSDTPHTLEAQTIPQSQAITEAHLEQRNGVLAPESTIAQTEINGAAPTSITMPPPKIQRTQTEFITPAEEPSQIQAFP